MLNTKKTKKSKKNDIKKKNKKAQLELAKYIDQYKSLNTNAIYNESESILSDANDDKQSIKLKALTTPDVANNVNAIPIGDIAISKSMPGKAICFSQISYKKITNTPDIKAPLDF